MFSTRRNSCKRITKVNPLLNKYKWKGINFPSKKDAWKRIEKNNVRIALNVLYSKKEKIYPAYVSKQNSNREKELFFWRFKKKWHKAKSEGRRQQWHYLAVKNYQHY